MNLIYMMGYRILRKGHLFGIVSKILGNYMDELNNNYTDELGNTYKDEV